MKKVIQYLLLSLGGLLILGLALVFSGLLPELIQKLLLLLGCGMFGYGIAYLIVEKKTPR